MSEFSTSFARNGNPESHGSTKWPRYDLKQRATMIIDVKCRVENDPDKQVREMREGFPK